MRSTLVLPLAIALILCAGPASADAPKAEPKPKPPGGTVLVLNKAGNTVRFVGRADGKERATLQTGIGPHEVAISPDGKTAVVANYGARTPGNTLSVYDIRARKALKTIDLGKHGRPHGIVFVPGQAKVVVTAEASRSLLIVDLESGAVDHVLDTAQNVSHMVALSPKGDRAYVANIGSHSITVLDLLKQQRIKVVKTGLQAEGVDVSPDGREVWVSNRRANTVSVVDAKKLEVVAQLKCVGFPIRVKFTPDGKRVLVSCALGGDVAVFDAATRKEVKRVRISDERRPAKGNMFRSRGALPIGILMPPDGLHAFVACGGYDELAVIDLRTLAVVERYPTGREPDGLGYSPFELPQASEK